jgi:hypothetical protein
MHRAGRWGDRGRRRSRASGRRVLPLDSKRSPAWFRVQAPSGPSRPSRASPRGGSPPDAGSTGRAWEGRSAGGIPRVQEKKGGGGPERARPGRRSRAGRTHHAGAAAKSDGGPDGAATRNRRWDGTGRKPHRPDSRSRDRGRPTPCRSRSTPRASWGDTAGCSLRARELLRPPPGTPPTLPRALPNARGYPGGFRRIPRHTSRGRSAG